MQVASIFAYNKGYDIISYYLHGKYDRAIYVKSYMDDVEAVPTNSPQCDTVRVNQPLQTFINLLMKPGTHHLYQYFNNHPSMFGTSIALTPHKTKENLTKIDWIA
ncbi:unnamed protein product [Caretta caretta]